MFFLRNFWLAKALLIGYMVFICHKRTDFWKFSKLFTKKENVRQVYVLICFQELVISQNFSGHLVAHSDWPSPLKNKGVYFVKREKEPLPKENFLSFVTCGDIHPNALDHFCAWVEEVSSRPLKINFKSNFEDLRCGWNVKVF